jgi:uncharacterized protein YndB with AHSA1/START domain
MAVKQKTGIVEHEVRIEASPETVFSFFTDPEKMVRWMGVAAVLDPRPGGIFQTNVVERFSAKGNYVEVEPDERIVFTWGWAEFGYGDPPIPPGSSTVEVVLVPDGEATILRLTHRDLPADLREFHAAGWGHYLARLAAVMAGEEPGPDPWAEVREDG